MDKAIGVVQENFNTMRTGRANPAILDKILVRKRAHAGACMRGCRRGCVVLRARSPAPALAAPERQGAALAACARLHSRAAHPALSPAPATRAGGLLRHPHAHQDDGQRCGARREHAAAHAL